MWMVLDAAGIAAEIDPYPGGWRVLVSEDDLPAAVHELEDYVEEMRDERRLPPPSIQIRPGGGAGVLAYVVTLVGTAGLAGRYAFGADWFEVGRLESWAVVEGQWWRAFTALTLHVDPAHLVSNLAFGAVFGFLAAQALGGGVAWLGILLAGGAGNLVNAYLQPPQHAAIGASTAVFGALGVLVALSLHHWRKRSGGLVRRWSPLIGGFLLLASTGMGGERTDVLAHVTGLLAGILVGFGASFVPSPVLDERSNQVMAACAALAVLLLSWAIALSGARSL
jgi:membrane associated rhomboid family serine protease